MRDRYKVMCKGSDIRCEGCNLFWVSGEVCSLFMYVLWYRLHLATCVLSTPMSSTHVLSTHTSLTYNLSTHTLSTHVSSMCTLFCLHYLVCTMFLSHLTPSVHILYVFTFCFYFSYGCAITIRHR